MSERRTNTFRRLLRKPAGVFGLAVIGIALIIAIFGYVIAPDGTPDADLQTIEIQSKPAGYTQKFLKIPKRVTVQTNFFDALFSGTPSHFQFIPIIAYHITGEKISIEKYVDEDTAVAEIISIAAVTANGKQNLEDAIITKKYLLGTDAFGRDILSRLIIGTRVSLAVGFIAVLISLSLGLFLGAIAGYFGGKTDALITWLINVTWSIPTLLLVFAITLAAGKGFLQIFIAIGLTLWVSAARLVRSQVMAVKQMEYVRAAKALGFRDSRIIARHIIPNIMGPVLVLAASNFATAIIIEAGLSFLGVGIQPPQPSWGLMLKENYNFIITNHATQALVPGFAIMLLVLAFNLTGNALRDVLDVRSH